MKRTSISTAAMVISLALLPCAARGELVSFYIGANADQVVGDVISPGTGAGWVQLDPETDTIEWSFIFGNLTGPATAAHFHGPAAPGENAGPQVPLDHSSNPIIGSTIINEAQKTDLLNEMWYINIHTAANPDGEIRGQVLKVIPEPATIVLAGLGGLALLRRRRAA